MSSPSEHSRTLTEEMELSAQTGDLPKLQSQLARWEAETTDQDPLCIDPTLAEIQDWGEMQSHTDTSKPVYRLLTRLLVEAAGGNQVATAKYLLEKRGVPVTPMIAKKGLNADAFDVLEVFLEHGWNINDPIKKNYCPTLGWVTHNEARTRWCLEHGADPNARNKNGWQDVPSQAGRFASVSTMRLLAAHGTNFPCSNALHRAAESRFRSQERMDVLRWLLDEAGFPINQREFEWDPAVFQNWRGNRVGTALHYAVVANSPDRVRFLLERGSDANLQDTYGQIARDWADRPEREEVFAILDGWGK